MNIEREIRWFFFKEAIKDFFNTLIHGPMDFSWVEPITKEELQELMSKIEREDCERIR